MATIVGNVTDLQQRHHLILLEDQRLSTKGKIVSKCYNISKTPGGVPSTLPVPRWGYEFACTSEG